MKLNLLFFGRTLAMAALAVLTSCNLQKSNLLDISEPAPPEVLVMDAELITFNIIKSQVLDKHCVGCHKVYEKDPTQSNKGDVNLETYEATVLKLKEVKDSIIDDFMPPRKRKDLKLTDDQKNLILKWIDSGAKEK